MKFCSKCGNQLVDEAVVCPKCGCPANGTAPVTSRPVQTESNGFAIAGLICAFFIPLLGLIFGCVGLSKSKQMNGNGRGVAIAAIVVSIIFMVLSVIIAVAVAGAAAAMANEIIANGGV